MNIIGREIETGVGLESSRGTPTTPSKWFKKIMSSILPRVEKVIDESSVGVLEDSEGARITKKWFDGDLEGILHADTLGYFLMNLYGHCDTTGDSNAGYSHEFTLDQNIEHPSLSIYRKDGAIESVKYGGGVVNTLELSATVDDYIRYKANIILATEASSSEVPSYDSEFDFIGRDISIKVADDEASLTGATALTVKELTLNFNANAIADHKFGSYNPDVYNSAFGIEVSLTKNYGDTTFEDLFKSNDYQYMQIKIEGEATLGTTGKPTITILLNKAQVQTWERTSEVNALATESITLKAFYNSTDTQASSVTVLNATPSYAIGS